MKNEKILVVEDDELIQSKILTQLTSIGYDAIDVSSNGEEAINKVGLLFPDLIIMDIKLKGDIDGIKVSEIIKDKYDIPVVFLTGHTDEDLIKKAKMTNPYGYLIKPITRRDLNIALEMAFFKHNLDKQLKLSEKRYRAIVEDQTELICRFDLNGKLLFVNEAYCNYYKKKRGNLLKSNYDIFFQDDEKKIIKKIISKLNKDNPVEQIEIKILLDDKEIKWQRWTYRSIFDDNDNIIEYQGVGFDITEKKNAQIQLIDEKERLAVTLRSISDGVIAADIDGNIILMNKIAEELTGWNLDEAYGKDINKILIIKDLKINNKINPFKEIINQKKAIEILYDTVLLNKNHEEKNISLSGSPIRNYNNSIIGVVLVFKDITEKIKIDAELQKTNKLESLGILAGGIAHDFNNIITGIMGNLSLAMLDISSEDEVFSILNEAEKAVKKAKDLAQQLLTFAKGGSPVKKTATIADIIKDSANFVLRGSNVECVFNIQDFLPMIEVDEGQINQVINNLIMNADQAMPEGGKIYVDVEKISLNDNKTMPLKNGNYIKISIKDEGIGIQEKHLSKIFDPYFTTKQKGNGLGLAISYSIIKKHDGYITVDSKLGEGTTFFIYLPVTNIINEEHDINIPDIITGAEKVLVMDDEDIVLKVVKRMLEHLGYKADLAKDGKEAIKKYIKEMKSNLKFDVVIMDLTVPGKMGGEKAVKELLKIDPNAKVIVSSGYSNDPIMANYKDYGFINYIAKPYKIEELSFILRKVIEI